MAASDKEKTIGFLLLRFFYAQFWILQSFGKIYDQESGIIAWRNLDIWAWNTTKWFAAKTILPAWSVFPYLLAIPYVEFALGIFLLFGMQTRKTLIYSAILLISLQSGLLLQLKHDTVALNMIHLLAIVWAIQWAKYDRWTIGEYLRSLPRS